MHNFVEMARLVSILISVLAMASSFVVADSRVKLTMTRITPETSRVTFIATTDSSYMSVASGDKYKLAVTGSPFKLTEAEESRTVRTWDTYSESIRNEVKTFSVSNNVIERKLDFSMKMYKNSNAQIKFFTSVKDVKDALGSVAFTYTSGTTKASDTLTVKMYPSLAKKVKFTLDFDKKSTFDRSAQFFFTSSPLNYDLPTGLTITIEKPYFFDAPNTFTCFNYNLPIDIVKVSDQTLSIPTALRAGQSLDIACRDNAWVAAPSFLDFSATHIFTTEAVITSNTLPAVHDSTIPGEWDRVRDWFRTLGFIFTCIGVGLAALAAVWFYRNRVRSRGIRSLILGDLGTTPAPAPAQPAYQGGAPAYMPPPTQGGYVPPAPVPYTAAPAPVNAPAPVYSQGPVPAPSYHPGYAQQQDYSNPQPYTRLQ